MYLLYYTYYIDRPVPQAQPQASPKSKYTSSRSPEELKEILDDISYDNVKPIGKSKQSKIQSADNSSRRLAEKESIDDAWSPTPYAAFKLLVSSRFAAALWTTISDCDETYNYWEPVKITVSLQFHP